MNIKLDFPFFFKNTDATLGFFAENRNIFKNLFEYSQGSYFRVNGEKHSISLNDEFRYNHYCIGNFF